MEHSFSERINTLKGELEFNFLKVFTVRGIRYFITVFDDKLKCHLFYMGKINRNWTIINKPKVPEWILQLEEKLEKATVANGG